MLPPSLDIRRNLHIKNYLSDFLRRTGSSILELTVLEPDFFGQRMARLANFFLPARDPLRDFQRHAGFTSMYLLSYFSVDGYSR